MKRFISQLLILSVLLLLAPSAFAQATRTWISGVGDDANPCSRTAPCKTFAGAISKTATGGEIDVLDPGGFGALTITKPITIDGGGGVVASALTSGTNGFIVNSTATGPVILRNLSINGAGSPGPAPTGLNGVRYLAGTQLVIENCNIFGFTNNGVDVAVATGGDVVIHNTNFTNIGQSAVNFVTTAGTLSGSLSNVAIRGAANGVVTGATGASSVMVEVSNSTITQTTGFGLHAVQGSISTENNILSSNATAVQADTGATVRLSNNGIYNNVTGIGSGGGTVSSATNNRKAGNTTPGAPNATISVQ